MGSSTALALAKRGVQVTLFDQFGFGHAQGSSHGRSRIVRRAYPDPYFTGLMSEAYPLWRDLDARAGGGILHECGLMYVGQADSPRVLSMQEGLSEQGAEFTVMDEQGETCPFRRVSGEVGVFVREGGWVAADHALRSSQKIAQEMGASLEPTHLLPEKFRNFDSVVVAVGGWVKEWVPQLPVRVTKQTFGYVPMPYREGPVWIIDDDYGTYGFPPEPGTDLVKIGIHRLGPEIDPNAPDRIPEEGDIRLIEEFVRERFGLERSVVQPTACLYTSTASEDFFWGNIPGFDVPVAFASPCSGHGFKFGPWVGERLADFATGTRQPSEWPRFYWSAQQ